MFIPFPTREHLEQPDYKLGQDLLAWWLIRIATDKGLNPYDLPSSTITELVNETLEWDSRDVLHAMLEKSIKRAGRGHIAQERGENDAAMDEYAIAGQMVRVLFFDGHANLVAHDEAATGTRRQKRNASNPRPKKGPTLKSLVMKEMRKWKNKDHTFDEFMGAAQEDSIDGLSMLEEKAQNGKNAGRLVFVVNWEGFTEEEKLLKTLSDWWTDSSKKI